MAWRSGDPFPTIPNLERPVPQLGIGDRINNVMGILRKVLAPPLAPAMTPEQKQRAADLSVVPPSQRPELNAILNDMDKTKMKIK